MDCYPSFTVLAHRCFLTHAVWRNHRGSTPFKEQKLQRISWQPSPAVVGVRVFVVLGVTIPHVPNVWNIMKYLPTFGWKNYGTCIGKYSSAMDHMGIAKTHYITLTIHTVEEQNLTRTSWPGKCKLHALNQLYLFALSEHLDSSNEEVCWYVKKWTSRNPTEINQPCPRGWLVLGRHTHKPSFGLLCC